MEEHGARRDACLGGDGSTNVRGLEAVALEMGRRPPIRCERASPPSERRAFPVLALPASFVTERVH